MFAKGAMHQRAITPQSSPRHGGKEKRVEAMFAELKNVIGLRRLRLCRMKFVREQFFLAAAAQNIKRLVRFLSKPTTPTMEAAT
jgi:Transposase DDE domain